MNGERGFTEEVHRYLDGESISPGSEAQAEADQFAEAIANYAVGLELPGSEVDELVMRALRSRRSARRPAWWRWFVQPQVVRLRPVLAAAIVALVVGVTWFAVREEAAPRDRVGPAAAESQSVLVRFELRAPNASQVAVAGSFSDWDEGGIPLTLNRATGVWTVTLPLMPGEHEYLFVIDGERWVPDPAAHAQVDDGFGQVNSVIVVGPRGVVRS